MIFFYVFISLRHASRFENIEEVKHGKIEMVRSLSTTEWMSYLQQIP